MKNPISLNNLFYLFISVRRVYYKDYGTVPFVYFVCILCVFCKPYFPCDFFGIQFFSFLKRDQRVNEREDKIKQIKFIRSLVA